MDINKVPRDIAALKALPRAQRYRLFVQLHVDGTSDEIEERFLSATTEKQAEHLLALLQSLDAENESGYRIKSISLPKRSKDHRTNEKRMAKFADKIERTLNELNDTCQRVNVVHFETHGVLVVGYSPPAQQTALFPPGMIPAMFSRIGSPPDGQESKSELSKLSGEERWRFTALCNQAFTLVATPGNESRLNKDLDDLFARILNGVSNETVESYIQELYRLESEHEITHGSDDACDLSMMFDVVKSRLMLRVHLATN